MDYCNECRYFSDLGRCRNGSTRRSDVGYFQKARPKGEPRVQEPKKIEQENPKIEHTMTEIEQTPKTKHCNKCGRDLPLEAFGKKTGTKDGLQSWCKECQKESTLAARERKKQASSLTPADSPTPEKKPKRAPRSEVILPNGKHTETPSSDPEVIRARRWLREAVAPAIPNEEDVAKMVHFASSKMLIAELTQRGWKGTLTFTTTAHLNCE